METNIGSRVVPVEDGPPSIVVFTGGANGPDEAGRYAFWTAVCEDGALTFGRALEGMPPGERFSRMEGDPAYADHWAVASRAAFIRPSTAGEVQAWCQGHRRDAAFADEAEIGGQRHRVKIRIVRVVDRE